MVFRRSIYCFRGLGKAKRDAFGGNRASTAGILLAGGIPVPIYPPFRADRIAEYAKRQSNILRNAEARFLITWRQAEGLARLLKPGVPTLRDVLNAQELANTTTEPQQESAPSQWRPVENLAHHARAKDIAFLQYTSGSTGDPKGVMLTHANLLANIHSIVSGIEIKPDDVAVHGALAERSIATRC